MRYSERSPINGRFVKVDPERDLVPVNVSAADVYEVSDNSIGWPPAPEVTDQPEAEPFHHWEIVRAPGLRDPYGRADMHLVERAQLGTGAQP